VYPVSQAITGYFGSVTRQAVILLQRKFKLSTIGEVGPATRALLNALGVQNQ
jgi:peptidoglycan hydrolase-like protein with peptidoglycan-binding domain